MGTYLRLQAIGGETGQSTQERVDDDAHPQQLRDGSERCISCVSAARRRRLVRDIGPRGGDQGSCSVRVHEHQVPRAAPMRPAEHGEGASFERMLPARHRHAFGQPVEVVVMGSMSCVPSTTSIITH
jgi:hypothetical protein